MAGHRARFLLASLGLAGALAAGLGLAGALAATPEPAGALAPRGSGALAPNTPVFAEHAHLAAQSLLLGIAAADGRFVAVGERGNVVLSDDQGHTWVQAETVPTRALLTGVCFSSEQQGVAVGHDEVIMTTRDAGRNWTLVHFAPQAQQPLLDVTCLPHGRVIAVGAYGTYLTSGDGGATWEEKKFTASPSKVAAQATADDIGRDLHLNRIVAATSSRLYIAAEGGHLYRSDDGGETWRELASPYDGTFFGITALGTDTVLAYGMRGNLFRSEDAGSTWRRIETGTQAMLNDVVTLAPTTLAAVGLSGAVLVSHDLGRSFALVQQDDRKGLQAAAAVNGDTLVTVGEGGVKRVRVLNE